MAALGPEAARQAAPAPRATTEGFEDVLAAPAELPSGDWPAERRTAAARGPALTDR